MAHFIKRKGYEGVALAMPVTVPYERYSIRGAHWFLGQAVRALVQGSGLGKDQIDGLTVTNTTITPDLIAVAVTCTAATATCPACGRPSDRVHSRYRRTLADLPANGRRFVLRITARRFLCREPGCERRIFCERLPELVDAHARGTRRLTELHRLIGFALGGEPGSRLAEGLAAPTSGDTILRRVKATPAGPEPVSRALAAHAARVG